MNRFYNYIFTMVAALTCVACSLEEHTFSAPMVISSRSIECSMEEQSFEIGISHKPSYSLSYEVDADWITIDMTPRTPDATYMWIYVSHNLTTEQRIATISVTIKDPEYFSPEMGTYTQTIVVTQEEGYAWAQCVFEGESSINAPADGITSLLSIKTNIADYELYHPEWITINEKVEDGGGVDWDVYSITIQTNTDQLSRSGWINIQNESHHYSIRVEQEGMTYIFETDPTEFLIVSKEAAEYEITVRTNLSWAAVIRSTSYSSDQDTSWLTIDTPRCDIKTVSTPTTTKLKFSVTENNTYFTRYANIVVYSTEHSHPDVYSVWKNTITIDQRY